SVRLRRLLCRHRPAARSGVQEFDRLVRPHESPTERCRLILRRYGMPCAIRIGPLDDALDLNRPRPVAPDLHPCTRPHPVAQHLNWTQLIYAGRNRTFARNGSTWGRTRSLRHSAAGWIKPGNDTNCAPGISEAVCRAGLWIGSALPAYMSVGTAILPTASENPLLFNRCPCPQAIKAA